MNEHEPDNFQPLDQPEWLSWLQAGAQTGIRHWERGLLVILTLAVLGMATSLLWPRPQAVISLKPYASSLPPVGEVQADSTEAAPAEADSNPEEAFTEAATASESDEDQDEPKTHAKAHKKRGGHPHSAKKPDHPPITNLNTAKLEQLQLLPGIGPKMAERVLEYRKANGGFKNVEQVMDVKGIGPKKFEKMKSFLRV